MAYRSGFVTIIGKPNVGKSTFLNCVLGEKVSSVSPKPQTTRNRIRGILTGGDFQIVFQDTPGIIKKTTKLSEFMQKSIQLASSDSDIMLFMIDALRGMGREEEELFQKYGQRPLIVLVNKTDKAKPEQVMPILQRLSEMGLSEVYPISARTGKNVDLVLKRIAQLLPKGQKYYPDDMVTDRTERFMAAEIIREKTLLFYDQEVPHGIGVNITKFEYNEEKGLIAIDAEIYCEKESHKAIIIGKQGTGLKKVGAEARKEIENLVGTKVFLTLWIKVKEKWRDNELVLNELGYNKKNA
jgi:GTP-binding protein Era